MTSLRNNAMTTVPNDHGGGGAQAVVVFATGRRQMLPAPHLKCIATNPARPCRPAGEQPSRGENRDGAAPRWIVRLLRFSPSAPDERSRDEPDTGPFERGRVKARLARIMVAGRAGLRYSQAANLDAVLGKSA